jgi:hypothetical protein
MYMHTSRTLAKMNIPHYITIEPHEEKQYQKALEEFNLKELVTLIIAPFSNHGDGPGRARNLCWDHSINLGAKRHWVMDDNIDSFYRLHKNKRVRVNSSAMFRVMEDFVDRYENVKLAGPNYRFFCVNDDSYPVFVLNTRIYSCILIENDCRHRWRGRYNEDTDLSLRVLKDGDCTVQFDIFLQGKLATQTLKGGNTEEFYHKEIGIDSETGEAIKVDSVKPQNKQYNVLGTVAKSQMLVDMHPDVASLVWKFNRWHHYVDYNPFKKNELKFKPGIVIPKGVNNYGMKLIRTDTGEEYID